jgi:copper homeostasis protein CutC
MSGSRRSRESRSRRRSMSGSRMYTTPRMGRGIDISDIGVSTKSGAIRPHAHTFSNDVQDGRVMKDDSGAYTSNHTSGIGGGRACHRGYVDERRAHMAVQTSGGTQYTCMVFRECASADGAADPNSA